MFDDIADTPPAQSELSTGPAITAHGERQDARDPNSERSSIAQAGVRRQGHDEEPTGTAQSSTLSPGDPEWCLAWEAIPTG
jgi:hypothetical protein